MNPPRTTHSRITLGVCLLAAAWCLATLAFVLVRSSVNGLHFAGPFAGSSQALSCAIWPGSVTRGCTSWLRAARVWAWGAPGLAVVPGAFYSAHTFHDIFYSHDYPFALASGEQRAVNALDRDPPRRGTVLTTGYLGQGLPALAGLLNGQVTTPGSRRDPAALARQIQQQQVSVVASDCLREGTQLSTAAAALGFREQRYGCAAVWRR